MSGPRDARGDDSWLRERLEGAARPVRAPRGFSQRVMDAVYREALAGRPRAVLGTTPGAMPGAVPGTVPQAAAPGRVSRLYRRLALSFMITAAVLTVSLLVPRGAYPTLIGSRSGTALGTGPSSAVQSALAGAADAVQGALGERMIGGTQQ